MDFVPVLSEHHQLGVGPRISVHPINPYGRELEGNRQWLLQGWMEFGIAEARAIEIRDQIMDRSLEDFRSTQSPDYRAEPAPEWMRRMAAGVASDIESFSELMIIGGAQFDDTFYLAYALVNVGEIGIFLAEFALHGFDYSPRLLQTKFLKSRYS
ncbi:MAG: hypothetical protein GY747_05000 [Planctomycetes bacterium]|nr:hypothetical protein [Planctomycetota bacterium]MCP4770085.1 hypothetical protein [Planctomycetota bacterium]MCP4860767.1 hypothetical protein [Planctomycetota bacterium]